VPSPDERNDSLPVLGVVFKLGEVPLVAHSGSYDLVDGDPGPDHHPSSVLRSKDEHEAGIDDDLTHVVGAGDIIEEGALWHGVFVGIADFQLCKDLVSL